MPPHTSPFSPKPPHTVSLLPNPHQVNGALAPEEELPDSAAATPAATASGYRRELFVGLLDIFGSEVLGSSRLYLPYISPI